MLPESGLTDWLHRLIPKMPVTIGLAQSIPILRVGASDDTALSTFPVLAVVSPAPGPSGSKAAFLGKRSRGVLAIFFWQTRG